MRGLAHCEYGEGFLIFDRYALWHGHGNDAKEVWRLVSDEPGTSGPGEYEVVPESQPDRIQLHPAHTYSLGGRLKFVPHALLRPPGNVPTRAFRFVYPTLLVGGEDTLFLWDVRTGRLVERMDDIQRQMPKRIGGVGSREVVRGEDAQAHTEQGAMAATQGMETESEEGSEGDDDNDDEGDANSQASQALDEDELGDICYVEVNDKYAFVCGSGVFKVFRRRTTDVDTARGESEASRTADCVLAVTESQLRRQGTWYFRVGYVKSEDLPEGFKSWRERGVLDPIANVWKDSNKVVVRHNTVLSRLSAASLPPTWQNQHCSAGK